LQTIKGQLECAPRFGYELSQTVMKDMGRNPDYVSSFQAPSCILNQRVSASRRFAAQSFEFSRLRHISKALGVTIHDVVYVICSAALREYLLSQNALSKKPLIAMVPASVRCDDSAASNRITMILANLGTHNEDPLEGLQTVSGSVLSAK